MRYYGTTYKDTMIRKVAEARDSVGIIDYSKSINGVSVNQNRQGIKNDCAQVAAHAHHSIYLAQQKFDNLITLLEKFYTDVDDSAEYVSKQAGIILELLNMVNSSMQRINDALNETGEYEGTKVTAEIIEAAGIDEEKCIETEEKSWENFLNDEKAVAIYIEDIKSKIENGEEISEEELEKVTAIYNYYVENRCTDSSLLDKSDQYLENCINAYEIINPQAKAKTDEFFEKGYESNDETVYSNILRIKYAMYTADPEYRDIMLDYLPELKLDIAASNSQYTYKDNTIHVNLYESQSGENFNFYSFFHELGHGIDDVAFQDKDQARYYVSGCLYDVMKKDLTNDMEKVLKANGIELEDAEKDSLFAYIFSAENCNVVDDNKCYKDYLPSDWNDDQMKAYSVLRTNYGCKEFTYTGGSDVYTSKDTWGRNHVDNEMILDSIGGLTNGKLAGISGAHSIDSKRNEPENKKKLSKVKGVDDLKDYITGNEYYYLKEGDSRYPSGNIGTEFFAESFEGEVLGSPSYENSQYFPEATETYRTLISYISGVHPYEIDEN